MENQVQNRIVDASKNLFFNNGFSRVTMDDIASSCGISKKTLYANFQSKDALINYIICQTEEHLIDHVSRILNDTTMPAVRRLKEVFSVVSLESLQFAPLFREDMKRFQPKSWAELQNYKRTNISDAVRSIIREGKEEGFIKKSLPENFIIHLCFTITDNMLTPETIYELSMSFHDIFENVMSVLFEGFLTESGRKEIYSL